jgi:hypothetical protein
LAFNKISASLRLSGNPCILVEKVALVGVHFVPLSFVSTDIVGSLFILTSFWLRATIHSLMPALPFNTLGVEAVKKSPNEQKHLAQRRKGAEAAKKTKQLFNSNLCVSAPLREMVYFFTPSTPWDSASKDRFRP